LTISSTVIQRGFIAHPRIPQFAHPHILLDYLSQVQTKKPALKRRVLCLCWKNR
jgi:hypothetical protein